MSYLTTYFPQETMTFLEAQPTLAKLVGLVGFVVLIYSAVGLLILWRVKFYRPKPIQPKEPKPKGLNFWDALISRFPITVAILTCILGGLFGLLLALATFSGICHLFFTGRVGLEYLILLGFLSLFSFGVWLIIR